MRLLSRRLGLVLASLAGVAGAGCSAPSSDGLTITLPPSLPETASIRFDDTSTLELALGASQAMGFRATPPMAYRVGLTLLGPTLDGSLEDSVIYTGGDGRGTFTLHAPTTPTTFRIRASLLGPDGAPGASAERSVSVSAEGFGSIKVMPSYLGHRTVTTWTASVTAQASCADLKSAGILPGEGPGAIVATAASSAEPLIETAPVGPPLAVTIRAGHFAWGCADTTMLTAGGVLEVPIPVVDAPLDLADADLGATFDYTPDPTTYDPVMADAVATLVDAFMPESSSEGTILLNGMAAATAPADAATFATSRVDQSWDTLADQHFSALGQSLRATCSAWATAGTAALPTSVQADLTGGPGGSLTITLTQLNGLDAATAGAGVLPGATWSGLPDDSLLLTGSLSWEPSRYAGAAALGPALAAHPGAGAVAVALADEADCHGLATTLGAFGSCSVDCVEKLCDAAIAARWKTALETSSKTATLGSLVIQGSGKTTVGDVAEPITLVGQWQGQIGTATSQAELKGGSLTGAANQPAP